MTTIDEYTEWLEADGLGGFAMGTTSLVRTRRYHALLCTATTPPTGRAVLVAGVDAELELAGGRHPLSVQRYAGDVLAPRGDRHLAAFTAAPWPTWQFELPDGGRVQHELFVAKGSSRVVLSWRLSAPEGAPAFAGPVLLRIRPFLAGRDYHTLLRGDAGPPVHTQQRADTVAWQLAPPMPAVVARANGTFHDDAHWVRDFVYAEERARGYDAREDLRSPGVFTFDLARGEAVLAFAAEVQPAAPPAADPAATPAPESSPEPSREPLRDLLAEVDDLRQQERARRRSFPSPAQLAADAYVVRRGRGRTLVAGYPWFTDWGRDTFLSLRGLCLATRQLDVARDVLLEWSRHVDRGMLPNRFPDRDGPIEAHTADAALWFVIAAHEYLVAAEAPPSEHRTLGAAILAIVDGYARGTRHGIALGDDGLLRAGEPSVQLTWMDAIVDGKVVTPRIGKPVELQALWGNALRIAAQFDARWQPAAEMLPAQFAKHFWNPTRACLFDVVDSDHVAGRHDASVRPNQVLAVGGLPFPLLTGARARAVVDVVEQTLWTPLGLRTLEPGSPGYCGRYEGGPSQRDLAYHNGTAWPWLLGPFVEAWVRVRGNTRAARAAARARFLEPLRTHREQAGLGHISEIADGDAPHAVRGCPFQAWSLGEFLRLDLQVLAAPAAHVRATVA